MRSNILLAAALGASCVAAARGPGSAYVVDTRLTGQVIRGIGYEIQSDSIGSGNHGLPEANTSVPNDLIPTEKTRFFTQMLSGFRYCRLALGLYFRGTDASQAHIQERWPGQAAGLAQMAVESGIEGFDVEYWSPTPAWKDTQAYIGGSLAGFNTSFLQAFGAAVVQDLQYLASHGMPVTQWGLQNEPPVGPGGCIYSCCGYSHEQYYQTFAVVAPMVRAAFPNCTIHANSWGGQHDAVMIANDSTTRAFVDGWTFHCVGCNSDAQFGGGTYVQDTYGLPVWNNEFEYLSGIVDFNYTLVNTAQSIMNWFTFVNSPTWFWLHALKPTYNSEALGYGLGFWRPWDDDDFNVTHFPNLPKGNWQFNDVNWNAVSGFVRYLPWDSVRVIVNESESLTDHRTLAYMFSPAAARWMPTFGNAEYAGVSFLGMVLTNRNASTPFTYTLSLPSFTPDNPPSFAGYQYNLTVNDMPLGVVEAALNATTGEPFINVTLPPSSIQFWVQILR